MTMLCKVITIGGCRATAVPGSGVHEAELDTEHESAGLRTAGAALTAGFSAAAAGIRTCPTVPVTVTAVFRRTRLRRRWRRMRRQRTICGASRRT